MSSPLFLNNTLKVVSRDHLVSSSKSTEVALENLAIARQLIQMFLKMEEQPMIEFLDSVDVVVDKPEILDNEYSADLCPGYEVLRADKSGKLHSALLWKLVDCWSLHSSEPQTLEQILSKFKISRSATEHDLFWRCRNGIMEPSIKWCMREREALRLVEHHLRLIRQPTETCSARLPLALLL
jgi:hypothetical protein